MTMEQELFELKWGRKKHLKGVEKGGERYAYGVEAVNICLCENF